MSTVDIKLEILGGAGRIFTMRQPSVGMAYHLAGIHRRRGVSLERLREVYAEMAPKHGYPAWDEVAARVPGILEEWRAEDQRAGQVAREQKH